MAREVKIAIVGDVSRFEHALGRADRGLDRLGASAKRAQTLLAGAFAGGIAIRGVESIVKTFGDYDTALREVGAVSSASSAQLKQMGEIAREAGLSTGLGATASAQAMGELAKAGLSVSQLGPALKGTLALAQAGGLGTAEAAAAAANAMQTFGLRAADTTKVADAFANAANLTTADVGHFAQALEQGGAAAKLVGSDFKNTTLVLTELARIGIKGSDAGTSLKTAFLQLANPTAKAKDALEKYHLQFFKGNGTIKDAADLSDMLRQRLGGLNQQQQTAVLQTIAGTDGFRTLAAMMRVSGDESDKLMRQLTRQGSAAETAAAKNAGFDGSMKKLRASAQELGISLGDEFAPDIAKFADKLSKLSKDPAFKDEFVKTFRSGLNAAKDFGEALKPGVEVLGDAAKFFGQLPGPVQQTAIQLGVLATVARRLSGPLGMVGATGAVGKLRTELRGVPADARKAQAALAGASMLGTGAGRGRGPAGRGAERTESGAIVMGAGYETERRMRLAARKQEALLAQQRAEMSRTERALRDRASQLRASAGGMLAANSRGLAAGAVLGGAGGALMSGGDPATGALSGAALGAPGGVLGMAAGAIAGGGITALKNAFDHADRKKAEDAARRYAQDVTRGTSRAMQAGLRVSDATKVATSVAQARRARGRVDELQRAIDTAPEFAKDKARALMPAAQRELRMSNDASVRAFSSGLKSIKLADASGLLKQFKDQLATAPRAAQQQGANAMVAFARSLEQSGSAPKGTVDRLIKSLWREFDGLRPKVGKAAADSAREFSRNLNFDRIAKDANVFAGRIVDKYRVVADLPRVAVRSLPGAAATLRDQLDRLGDIAEKGDPSSKLTKAAKRSLPRLEQEYRTVLRAMGRQMNMTEKEADAWAATQARAARRAGRGSLDVDKLKSSVRSLSAQMLSGEDAARRVERAWRDAGVSARTAAGAGQAVEALTDFANPFSNKKRRGGVIRKYAFGGLVPSMVSSGEEIEYGGRSMIVPGPRVAADNVPMMLPQGAKVWTEHSQMMRAAGMPVDVNSQVPHFAKGGTVRGRVSVFGPPLEAAGKTANGMSSGQAGIALNIQPGTDGGWNNATTNRWVQARQPFLVQIAGRRAVLPMIDKGPAGSTGRAIDVTGAGARKMGINPSKFPTDKIGTATPVGKGSKLPAGTAGLDLTYKQALRLGRSRTRGGILPDAFSAGFGAVDTFGSLSNARRYGNPALPQISEALASQEYAKDVTVNIPGVKGSRKASLGGKAGVGASSSRLQYAMQKAREFGLRITSTTGGTHAKNSWHYKGRAFDASNANSPTPQMRNFALWAAKTYGKSALEMFYDPLGWYIKNGSRISGAIGGHSNHVHLALRRGGRVPSFATGGIVGGGTSLGRTQLTAPLRAPLSAVRKGAGPDQLKALDDAIGIATQSRVEKLRDSLLKEIGKGGDKKTIARLQAAVSVLEANLGGRIQERLESVIGESGFMAKVDKAKSKGMMHLQMEGLDESSVGGLAVTASSAADFLAGYGRSRGSLTKAREDAKRLMRKAKSPEAIAALAAKAADAREALAQLDERRDQALVDQATAARELPRAQAAERLSGFDLEAAFAALTPDGGDDADVLRRRTAATQEELDKAIRRGDKVAQLDLATQLKSLKDSIDGATQELKDQAQRRDDMKQQELDQQAKLIHLVQTEAGAVPAALLAFANDGIGRRLSASMATSAVPGEKWHP